MPVSSSRSNTSLPRSDRRLVLEGEFREESEASPSAASEASTWRDGRSVGRHIVDRALDYVALERGGLRAAQIARRRNKSKGYVSIVLRLGHALGGLDRDEIAVFRSERITWKLAQRIVRAGATDAEIQRQLRYALGGFSTHNIDRRKLRKHRGTVTGPKLHSPQGLESNASVGQTDALGPEPGVFVWRWDAGWAARDPGGYVDAYRAHLASLHRGMTTKLREAAASRIAPASIPLAGQSLQQLMRLMAHQRSTRASSSGFRPEDRAAIATLDAIGQLLERVAERVSRLGDDARATSEDIQEP